MHARAHAHIERERETHTHTFLDTGFSVGKFGTAGMPERLTYFKVAYAMRVQPSRETHMKRT